MICHGFETICHGFVTTLSRVKSLLCSTYSECHGFFSIYRTRELKKEEEKIYIEVATSNS